jgi:hypothetical protein
MSNCEKNESRAEYQQRQPGVFKATIKRPFSHKVAHHYKYVMIGKTIFCQVRAGCNGGAVASTLKLTSWTVSRSKV